jgi:hypothetical protein
MTFYFYSGSASGSVSQRYGSEDPDPHPDPYQNVTDPQHWYIHENIYEIGLYSTPYMLIIELYKVLVVHSLSVKLEATLRHMIID